MSNLKVAVRGIGAYLPGEPVGIEDIDSYLGEVPGVNMSKYYRIIGKYAGVRYRHYALEKGSGKLLEDSPTLCVNASRLALERAGVAGTDLDVIITTTTTPPYLRAGLAKEVRIRLGNKSCATYDLWGACTGIQQAMTVAVGGIRSGIFRSALLIGVELVSTSGRAQNYTPDKVGKYDMLLRAALGDGAGALVLTGSGEPNAEDDVLYTRSGTEGIDDTAFHREAGGSTVPFSEETLREGLHHWQHDFSRMAERGKPYFLELVRRTLTEAGVEIGDVDHIIPAAANFNYFRTEELEASTELSQAFLDAVREKVFTNFSEAGNVPSAAVYVAMNELYEEGRIHPGNIILLPSIEGATWGWGASLFRWSGS